MTREEERKLIQEFVEKNGVTQLPPDQRGRDMVVISAWGPSRKKKKKGGKKKKK